MTSALLTLLILSPVSTPCLATSPIGTPAPSVTVLSPNGLQRWEAGSNRTILFDSVDVRDVRIDFSDDAGISWSSIVLSTPAASGAFVWTLPFSTGDQYLVRVSDAGDSGASDACDQTFAIVPDVPGAEFDLVFFADSPTSVHYDPSWSFVTAPSTLVQFGTTLPVTPARSLVGNYSLSVEWSSQTGGDWGAAVASVGWVSHDVTQADSLVFDVYTDRTTARADLPCIYLEDLSNVRSTKIPLSALTGEVPARTWHHVAMPVRAFFDNRGSTDMTRVKTIFFGQQDADGGAHHWFLDDIRMTGVEVVTGDDVPLIVVLGSSTAAGTGASLPDSSWVGRFRNYVENFNPQARVINLAVGGYTTYHIREDPYVPPVGRPAPSTRHNISCALAYRPWAIIVNLPSNDVASKYALQEGLDNYEAVKALADAARVPMWFSTAQPRNFVAQTQRDVLLAQTDSTFARFGGYAIDFWNGLSAANGTILSQYNSGDGIHLNDSGHALLYSRVIGAAAWDRVITAALDRRSEQR